MSTVVVYDTKFGNTEKIAQAIARGAGVRSKVTVVDTAEAALLLRDRPDLLIVGGPTQRRGPSPALRIFVDAIPSSITGVRVATFDTRYRGATWLMGSAAREAAKRLVRAGARLAAPPASFYVSKGGPLERQELEAGEVERAEAWGRSVAVAAATSASAS